MSQRIKQFTVLCIFICLPLMGLDPAKAWAIAYSFSSPALYYQPYVPLSGQDSFPLNLTTPYEAYGELEVGTATLRYLGLNSDGTSSYHISFPITYQFAIGEERISGSGWS